MYQVKKKYIDGYAILPCFKVKCIENGFGAELICNDFLSFLFLFFAPFWSGKITVTGEHYEF